LRFSDHPKSIHFGHEKASQSGWGGNLFAALDPQKTADQRIVGILKLRDLIDWESFCSVLETASGYIAEEGSIVDASFVAVPRQQNRREENKSRTVNGLQRHKTDKYK
jgi:hypothetical protein